MKILIKRKRKNLIMKMFMTTIPIFLLTACTPTHDEKPPLKTYGQLSDYENQSIRVLGFLSKTHEASGLYFDVKDLIDENEKCVDLRPFAEGEHGSRIELTGKLVISECNQDLICLKTCKEYKLLITEKP